MESPDSKSIALWAALAAFFSNLVALKVVALMVSDFNVRLGVGALLTSCAVAGTVYARERLNEARAQRRLDEQRKRLDS
jgi:hypothetical protein